MTSNYSIQTVKHYQISIEKFEKWARSNGIIDPSQADLDNYIA